MGTLNRLRIGAYHPNLACRELNRRFYDLFYGKKYNKKGVKIIDEDWDVLIILDACRKDMFYRCCSFEGRLTVRKSRGSNTKEFLYGNFNNESLLDTVYTTANPQFQKHRQDINANFYKIYNVWDSNRWDDDLGTVRPRQLTDIAKQKIKNHPNKRHIIHYLQPHYPFIDTDLENIGRKILKKNQAGFDLWGLQMRGEIDLSSERINKAYYKNLRLVFEVLADLIDEIPGKTVITSDHGNMVGERSRPIPIKEWGHPSGIYTPELVEIPWFVIENGDRPDIRAEKSVQEQEEVNNEVIEDRLKHLGYV